VVLLDLDGVVYLQGEPIPGVPEALRELREAGAAPMFVTNNASRRAAEVAELLTARGVPAAADEVCTSAQAAARLLEQRCAPGDGVLVVGSEALAAEVSAVGLRPIDGRDGAKPAAVVQGYGPTVGWRQLADATIAVRGGAWWLATNTDATMPSAHGVLPGNGTMVAAVATAVGRAPDAVAGKPSPVLLERAAAAHPYAAPIMVGDRWDTDIEAARAADMPSVLVLSGTTRPRDLPALPPRGRPRYVAWTAAGINETHPEVTGDDRRVRCREWSVSVDGERLTLSGDGTPLDALRAIAEACWRFERPAESIAGRGDQAARALSDLEW
jgi:HAD superfamily hydrolase (TIGR01450 family)